MIQLLQIFQDLASKLSGKLTINGYSEDLLHQSLAQESIYRLSFPYKKEELHIEYAVGATHYASLGVLIDSIVDIPEFEITTRSPFMTLFRGKKNRVKIKCDDSKLKNKIESNQHFLELKELSARVGFEPFTYGKVKNLGYEMRTEYPLQFPERTQELDSLIEFHKSLIDFVV